MAAPIDLVTYDAARTAFPDLDAQQLADLPAVITAASAEIGALYPRAALLARYDETHQVDYDRTLVLKRRPVKRVVRLRADMAAVLRVRHEGPARRATVTVAAEGDAGAFRTTALELTVGSAEPVVVAFRDAPTLDALARAVDDVGGGWSAEVGPGLGDLEAADLEAQGAFGAKGNGAALQAYTRDLDDFTLDHQAGSLLLYEWRAPGYRFPDRTWGVDPRSTSLRVLYDAGKTAADPDVVRAAILVVGDLLEATEYSGPVVEKTSDDAGWKIGVPNYRLPDRAARILSRFRDRRFA